MVSLYIEGRKLGTWAEAEKLFAEKTVTSAIEFRDDAGTLLGRYVPERNSTPSEPLIPWDPSITRADIERIKKEPGYTFEEMKTILGWK